MIMDFAALFCHKSLKNWALLLQGDRLSQPMHRCYFVDNIWGWVVLKYSQLPSSASEVWTCCYRSPCWWRSAVRWNWTKLMKAGLRSSFLLHIKYTVCTIEMWYNFFHPYFWQRWRYLEITQCRKNIMPWICSGKHIQERTQVKRLVKKLNFL